MEDIMEDILRYYYSNLLLVLKTLWKLSKSCKNKTGTREQKEMTTGVCTNVRNIFVINEKV